MTTPDKAQQPDHDAQELTDEDLDQASGGNGPSIWQLPAGVDGELEGTTVEGTSIKYGKKL